MSLAYRDGRILHGDIALPETVVLENVGGLTEKAVSEIVQNANIGEMVVKMLEGQRWGFWDVCNLVKVLQSTVEKERMDHWARCSRAGMPGTHVGQIMDIQGHTR